MRVVLLAGRVGLLHAGPHLSACSVSSKSPVDGAALTIMTVAPTVEPPKLSPNMRVSLLSRNGTRCRRAGGFCRAGRATCVEEVPSPHALDAPLHFRA